MKKIFYFFLLNLIFSSISFADSFYFKGCKLSDVITANYIINLDKKVIEVELKAVDGTTQKFFDEINVIEKNKISSKKIKSNKGDDIYYQYFFNSKSKSVTKLDFKKEIGDDFEVYNLFEKRESFCKDIKADWDKKKIEEAEIKKEKKEILKEQLKLKKEQSTLVDCQGSNYTQWTNCKGLFKSEAGYIFDGLFKNGEILKGTSIYPGGAKYVGEFLNFKPNGYGTFVWANGDKYFGNWKNGKSAGNGTKVWKDGRKYLGNFKNDNLDGIGTLFYPDGKKYEGDFVNGKRHGKGTFTFPDGTAYVGNFVKGKEEGLGECIGVEGISRPCKNKSDTQVKEFSGKDTKKVSVVAKKWIRVSHYENNSKKGKKILDRLKSDFKVEALKVCAAKGNYVVLQEKIEVLEIDETPAYGLETKLLIGINGVVECK